MRLLDGDLRVLESLGGSMPPQGYQAGRKYPVAFLIHGGRLLLLDRRLARRQP